MNLSERHSRQIQRTDAMISPPASSAQTALPAEVDVEAEYRSIERALLESARGRWFLAEHSRRARRVDSERLDDALARLQSSIRQPPALLGQLRNELSTLLAQLAEARARVMSKAAEPASEIAPAAMLKVGRGLACHGLGSAGFPDR